MEGPSSYIVHGEHTAPLLCHHSACASLLGFYVEDVRVVVDRSVSCGNVPAALVDGVADSNGARGPVGTVTGPPPPVSKVCGVLVAQNEQGLKSKE